MLPSRSVEHAKRVLRSDCANPLRRKREEPWQHWDTYTSFECGHETFGGFTQSPCPSDPKFPALEDYELRFHESRGAT